MATYSTHAFRRGAMSGTFVILCGIFTAVLVLLPVPIFYKIGLLTFIVMFLVFFTTPFFGMMIFLFIRPTIEPMINVQIIPGVPTVGIFSLGITIFLMFKFFTDRTYTIAVPHISFLWLLLPFSLFSMCNSIDLIESIAHLLRLIGWLSIYILVFNLTKTKEDIKKVIITLILSSIIPLLVGYYQLFTNTGAIDELRKLNRITSVFAGQPDTCAVFFSLIFFIILILYMLSRNLRIKILSSVVMLCILVLIIFTYHRGSQIGLVLGMMVVSTLHKKMIKIVIPLFLFVCLVFHDEIANRIHDLFAPSEYSGSSLTTRVELWKISLKLLSERPINGWGIGMAKEAIGRYFPVKMVPHNDYLRIAIEIGIFGVVLYLAFMLFEIRYYFLKIVANINREFNTIVLGLLIYFAIVSFGQNNFYNVNNMAILFSVLAISKKLNSIQSQNRMANYFTVKASH